MFATDFGAKTERCWKEFDKKRHKVMKSERGKKKREGGRDGGKVTKAEYKLGDAA